MHTPLRFEILNHVEEVIHLVRPIVEAIGRRDRALGAQVRDAMNSVGLNVLEGFGNRGGSSRSRFETALGSAYEVHAGVRFGVAWGYVTEAQVAAACGALDRLCGRVYGLARR
jgi:four helix bundle protein